MELYLIFAGIDYLLGLLTAILKGETKKGNVSSKVMTNGIIKKVCCMVLILVAWIIQNEMGIPEIYSMVYIGFVISEGLSILETCHDNGVTCKPLEHFFESKSKDTEKGE